MSMVSVQHIFTTAVIQFLETRMDALHCGAVTLDEFTKGLKSEIQGEMPVVADLKEPVVTKKVKKVKKKKDPHAPKKGKNAYLFFCAAKRPELKNDGVTGKDVMVKLGAMWKESALDKGPYNEMAVADRVRYAAEMKAYVPSEEDI